MSTTLERLIAEAGGLEAFAAGASGEIPVQERRPPGRPRKVSKDSVPVMTRLEPATARAFQAKIKERNLSIRDGLREAVERYVAEAS